MERTLYLSEKPGLRVSRDGPSLWIVEPGQAGRRVPARLIRRVVILGDVVLDAGSLTLFAERGVPVTLLRRDGAPSAQVLGLADGEDQRRARQAAAVENASRRERMLAWLAAWERGRQLALLSRMDEALAETWRRDGFRAGDYEAWVIRCGRAGGAVSRARAFFKGALHACLAAEIARRGWDPHVGLRCYGEPLGLVKDCSSAVGAEADRLWLESPRPSKVGMGRGGTEAWAARFEAGRPRLDALIGRLLDQFARLLIEG